MTNQFYIQKSFLTNSVNSISEKLRTFKLLLLLAIFFFATSGEAQTITGVSINPTELCGGVRTTLTFTVTNGVGAANHFTKTSQYLLYYTRGGAYVKIDQFTFPRPPADIDGASATVTKSLLVPTTFKTGIHYKLSVGSTGPNFNGSAGQNASPEFTISNPKAKMDKRYPISQCGGGSDGEIIIDTANALGIQPFQISSNGIVNATSKNYLFNNLVPGNYHIVSHDAIGCLVYDSTIIIGTASTMSVYASHVGQVSSCKANDGTISTSIIGGIEPIQVSLDGVNYQPKGKYVINNLKADTPYIITVRDFRGCTASSQPIIVKGPSPMIVSTSNYIGESACGVSDGAIFAKAGGGAITPVRYNLNETSPGHLSRPYQSSNYFNNLPAGTYLLGVSDSRGCTGSVTVVVPKNPPVIASSYDVKRVTTCGGTDGTIIGRGIGGSAPFSYSLSGPVNISFQSSNTLKNLPVGTYIETVRDSRNCEATNSIVVSGPACSERTYTTQRQAQSALNISGDQPLNVVVMQNPSSSRFRLNVQSGSNENISIFVADIYGKIVYRSTGSSNRIYQFGEDFPSGIYVVQLLQGKNLQNLKLVKTK